MNQSLTFETSPIYAIRCGFFVTSLFLLRLIFPHIAQANFIFYFIFFHTSPGKKTHTNTKREKSDKQETATLNPKHEQFQKPQWPNRAFV